MNITDTHTQLFAWGKVCYWQNGKACTAEDNWTKAEVYVIPHNGTSMLHSSTKSFLAALINGLNRAHESGKRARSKEIMELLS